MFRQITETINNEGIIRFIQRASEFAMLRSPLSNSYSRKIYSTIYPRIYRTFINTEYNLPINPLSIHWVDPEKIERVSGRPWPPLFVYPDAAQQFGEVESGNWDQTHDVEEKPGFSGSPHEFFRAETFEQTPIFQSLYQRYEQNRDWMDTDVVKCAIELANDNSKYYWRGCHSKKEIIERCREIDSLYESIRENGIVPLCELVVNGEHPGEPTYLDTLANEIMVDVGRNGELLISEGHHRLAVAKLLKVDRIPIVINVRHQQWIEQLEQSYPNLAHFEQDHPDVRSINEQNSWSQLKLN